MTPWVQEHDESSPKIRWVNSSDTGQCTEFHHHGDNQSCHISASVSLNLLHIYPVDPEGQMEYPMRSLLNLKGLYNHFGHIFVNASIRSEEICIESNVWEFHLISFCRYREVHVCADWTNSTVYSAIHTSV